MMDNLIRISEKQFFDYFKGDNYIWVKWTGKPKDVPEPPYLQAHLNWVFDKNSNRYVGYMSTSSYNDDVDYSILEELASAEMIEWYEKYTIEEKKRREESDKKWLEDYAKLPPRKPFDPAKPGLMEFIEKENNIPYNPEVGIDDMVKAFESVWYNKLKKI